MAEFVMGSALSGVIGNFTYDSVKTHIQRITGKSWEALYMQAFDEATRDSKAWISFHVGEDAPTLNVGELHNALHQDLGAHIEGMSFTQLDSSLFKKALANAMARRSVFEIGGHTYTDGDYASITLRLVEHATAQFHHLIFQDAPSWGRAIMAEAQVNEKRAAEFIALLQRDFGLQYETLQQMFSALKDLAAYAKSIDGKLEHLVQALAARTAISSTGEAKLVESTNAYGSWLAETTSDFLIPGLHVTLPIDSAWVQLRAYAPDTSKGDIVPDAVSYRELEKLADVTSRDKRVFPAEQVADRHRLTMLVARGGAGKSTLLRRLAHKLALNGKRVLRVRLPAVAARLRSNREETIEEVLTKVAVSGSSIDPGDMLPGLSDIEYLLADGLEECGTAAGLVAQSLVDWAHGHRKTRVITTTRYTGYDPSLLPGWSVVTLLPLSKGEIKEHARQIFAALYTDKSVAEEKLALFEQKLAAHPTAPIMARNPLLLGFLIALFAGEIPFEETAYGLYESIVQLAFREPMQDREIPDALHQTIALHVLHAAGWHLLHEPLPTKAEMLERIGREVEEALGLPALQAKQQAEVGIGFWEESRILETLPGLVFESVAFTHPALAEYAAGRYAAGLRPERLRNWIARVWANPKWHDAILVASAAGADRELAAFLLEAETGDPLFSTSIHLAAEVLAKSKAPSNKQIAAVVALLRDQLQSNVPLLAYEAVRPAVELTAHAQDLLLPLAQTMSHSDQSWTRLAGVRLAMSYSPEHVDITALERALDEGFTNLKSGPVGMHLDSSGGWPIWNEVVAKGAPLLMKRKPGHETVVRIANMIKRGNFNLNTHMALARLVTSTPGYETAAEGFAELEDVFKRLLDWGSDAMFLWPKAEEAMLEAVLAVTLPEGVDAASLLMGQPKLDEYPCLGELINGMGFVDAGARDWLELAVREDLPAVYAVLKGAIAALGIDSSRLAIEASWSLEENRTATGLRDIFSSLPPFTVEVNWTKASDLNLPPADLVRALSHPSDVIATNAAHILDAGAGQPEAAVLAKEVLVSGGKDALYALSQCAVGLWGEDALEIVLSRLDKEPLAGTEALLLSLPELAGTVTDERVLPALLRSLNSPRSVVSLVAADLLAQFDRTILVQHAVALKSAFTHWTEQGVFCEEHEEPVRTEGESCPKCGLVLHNPRERLFSILADLQAFTYDELVILCNDSHKDVQRKAQSAIVKRAAASGEAKVTVDMIRQIEASELPFGVLHAILQLQAELLAPVKGELLALLNSPSPHIRNRVLHSLTGMWIDRTEAEEYARGALQDDVPDIRDTAARVVRSLLRRH